MMERRATFNQEIFLLFVIVISLSFHQTKGLEVTMEQVGYPWSIGYQGDLYIANVDTNLVKKIRWSFNDEIEEQIYDLKNGTCQVISSNAASFTSSCEPTSTGMRSIFHLNRELQIIDDGSFLEIFAEVSESDHQTENTTLSVLYPIQADESNGFPCHWDVYWQGKCELEFESNPKADSCTILTDGNAIDGLSCYILEVGGRKQKAVVHGIDIDHADPVFGSHVMIITQKAFPSHVLELEFTIVMHEEVSEGLAYTAIVILSCCIGGLVLIIIIIALVAYCCCAVSVGTLCMSVLCCRKGKSAKSEINAAEDVDLSLTNAAGQNNEKV